MSNNLVTKNQFTNVRDSILKLQESLNNIEKNEEWLKFLSFQSKFYNYSFSNTMLIYMQNPSASYVAGYRKWLELGRFVKKGEHAIKVLAPCRYKIDDTDEDNYIIKGFKFVPVFDISQIDGNSDNLPIVISGLQGTINDEKEIYNNLLDIIDIPVKEKDRMPAKGCYHIDTQNIDIKSSLSTVQKIKTLIHEWAHFLHHTKYFEEEDCDIGEIIAESSAYIVCNYLKIDTSDYSIPYIKSWCNDIKKLHKVADKVQKISQDIINLLNKPLVNTACNKAV